MVDPAQPVLVGFELSGQCGAGHLAGGPAVGARGEPPPDIQVDKEIPGSTYYVAYANCLPDAFRTAAQTLFQRITRFGPANPQVRDWLGAQDAVFVNCSDGAAIPAAAPQTADPLGRVDRAYQIAAAHFYAGAFDTALAEFRAIAADAASPWRTLAPYLAARTLVRKGTLGAGEGEVDAKALAEADRQIGAILADPSLADVHPAALRLRGFVRFRSEPDARHNELAAELCRPKQGPELQQRLADYTLLLDKLIDDGEGEERAAPPSLPQDRDRGPDPLDPALPGGRRRRGRAGRARLAG